MKRKCRQGEIFKTIGELADWLASGKSVYMRNQYLHFGWVSSMQLRYLMQCIEHGVVVQALPNKEKEDAIEDIENMGEDAWNDGEIYEA